MKRVTTALAVSRSNTYERSRSPRPRPERYSKAEDAFLLPLIVELLGGRQTYGYRRIQRLLNRQLIAERTPVKLDTLKRRSVIQQSGPTSAPLEKFSFLGLGEKWRLFAMYLSYGDVTLGYHRTGLPKRSRYRSPCFPC